MKTFCLIALLLILTTSCFRVGPKYYTPDTNMPDSWHQALNDDFDDSAPPLEDWWNTFKDPHLSDLIQRADFYNITLKQAYARIVEARAVIQIVRSQYYPDVNALGSFQKIRASQGFPSLPLTATIHTIV